MNVLTLDPSLRQLLRFQRNARLRMCWRRIKTPRRLILTVLAFVLGALWIGQAILGILFRPAASPERLEGWIPIGLLSYALWHVLKTTCKKPIEPFEWTPTEVEMLAAAPLPRNQIVGYRLSSVVKAAAAKALLFAMVMLPDLPMWPLGFVGMLLALIFLDLLRMTLEVVAWGVSRRTFLWARCCIVTLAVGAIVSALAQACFLPTITAPSIPPVAGLLANFVHHLIGLQETLPVKIVQAPFLAFANVILAEGSALALAGWTTITTLMVTIAAKLLIELDLIFQRRRKQVAMAAFKDHVLESKTVSQKRHHAAANSVRVPMSCNGLTTIAWRQVLGMTHYGPSVLFAMLLPGFMSLLPLLTDTLPIDSVLQVAGGLIFYSFLLMPSALRFDFRRDVDRIAVLKALPISPMTMTLGQLAAPILACTLFQGTVLLVAMACRPYPFHTYLLCMALMLPVNAVIFGLENLIFMVFPYRPNQEGIAVFIRSILTFTAKGILFCFALVVLLVWIRAATMLAGLLPFEPQTNMLIILWGGIGCLLCVLATGLFTILARVYHGFDPSQDTPPMS